MLKFIFILTFLSSYTYGQSGFWERTNGPVGGSFNSYAIASDGSAYGSNGNGIFKSTDNGNNWHYSGLQDRSVYGICKTSSGTLLAAVSNGIYRSTDDGVNWFLKISINAYIPEIFDSGNGVIFAGSNSGIYRTVNDGVNWTSVNPTPVSSFAKSPVDGAIYATYSRDLIKSTDLGLNWNTVTSLQAYTLRSVSISDNGYIFTADRKGSLSRSTDNGQTFSELYSNTIYEPGIVAAGELSYVYCKTDYEGIWKSDDYGDTWSISYPGRDVNTLRRGLNGMIYSSKYGKGCITTTNNGYTWTESLNGIVNVNSGPLFMLNNGDIYSSSGQTSFDNGMNWNFHSIPIITSYCISVDRMNGYVFVTNGYNQIHRSTDNAKTFESFNVIPSGYGISNSAINGNEIFASGLGFYKSTNNGVNWMQISTQGFRVLAFNKKGYYFGSDNQGVFRSTDLGQSWELILPLSVYTLATINPVMVTSEGIVYAGGADGIFMSTNDGSDWIHEDTIPNVSTILEAPNGKIYASRYNFYSVNEGGVYVKEGNSWINMTHDLPRKNVLSFCFIKSGQMLVSTAGSGVFRSVNPIGIEEENSSTVKSYALHQNYPNPFNPSTTISYFIKSNGFVRIKVFDISGKEIDLLVNQFQFEGTHSVQFKSTGLASGVYYYSIEAGDFRESKKMLLIK